MGKGKRSHQSEEEIRQEFIDEEIVDLLGARSLAHELFGKDASPETVIACYERMADGEDVDEIEISHEIAQGGFQTTTPSPEMVFGVHDRLFLYDEDDEHDE